MIKERINILRKFVMFIDVFIISIAFFTALFLRQNYHKFYIFDLIPNKQIIPELFLPLSNYLIVLFIVIPLWLVIFYWNGIYRNIRTRDYFNVFWLVLKSTFLVSIGFGLFVYILKIEFVSRLFFVLFISISFSFILIEKFTFLYFLHFIRKREHNIRRLLIVGTGQRAANFIDKIRSHSEWGLKIVGVIDDEPDRGINIVNSVNVVGNIDDFPEILYNLAIDDVIFVVPRRRLDHLDKTIYACETEGVGVSIAGDLFDLRISRSQLSEVDGIPLITFKTTKAEEWHLFIKRILDLVISGVGIILLSPLFLVVAILIKLTSKGSIIYKQNRVTLNGRKFVLYKFRTMYKGADKKQPELGNLNEMGGPIFKIKKDPRITPVGKALRKFSIDEFPQLFNVFVGHMSLVGPRALPVYEIDKFKAWQRRRLSMRPGITCLWQVNGRNKLDFNKMIKLDLEYLDNWSLWLDFKILMKTIPVVLFGIGAY